MVVKSLPYSDFVSEIKKADPTSGYELLRLFIRGVENGFSRTPVIEHFKRHRKDLTVHMAMVENLWSWSSSHSFVLHSNQVSKPDESLTELSEHSVDDESAASNEEDGVELQSVFDSPAVQAGWLAGQRAEEIKEFYSRIAADHKYGFFPPGFEVYGAQWDAHFGANDPCVVISSYLQNLYSSQKRSSIAPSKYELHDADKQVLDLLLAKISKLLVSSNESLADLSQRDIRRVLNASCPAWLWGNQYDCFNQRYFTIARHMPSEILKCLILHWCDESPGWSRENGLVTHDTFWAQAEFVGGCLVKCLYSRGVRDNQSFPISDFMDEEEFEALPELSSITRSEILNIQDVMVGETERVIDGNEVSQSICECLYNARDPIFGGQLPFTRDDISAAYSYFGPLHTDERFWLACLANYNAEMYDPDYDPYTTYPEVLEDGIWSALRGLDAKPASIRFNSFKIAYHAMRQESLDELARSWWAFFVASQAHAFPNTGLSPLEIAEVLRISKECLPERSIELALKFAAARTVSEPNGLSGKVLRDGVKQISREFMDITSSVVSFQSTKFDPEQWLSKSLGDAVWRALMPASRQDLIDAERMWSDNSSQLGAEREDWGGLITFYGRVVESEAREHLSALLNKISDFVIPLKERTLGSIVFGLREAKEHLRKNSQSAFQRHEEERIRALHELFSKSSYLKSNRDRAAHGNREQPLGGKDLEQWRYGLFRERILSVIMGVHDDRSPTNGPG